MMRWIGIGLALLSATPLHAQQGSKAPGSATAQEGVDALQLRVLELRPGGEVVVDRGERDGLRPGDPVRLEPRGGQVVLGQVIDVGPRDSIVELRTPGAAPPPGTRGEVRIPRKRRVPRPAPTPAPNEEPAAPAEAPEEDPWSFTDDDWTDDMPLLASVGVLKPEDRPRRHTGRLTLQGDSIRWVDQERGDFFLRQGTDVEVENPFGYGGRFHFDGEFNWRRTSVPEEFGQSEELTDFRLDRFSYAVGGTRFQKHRVEVGRFLQHGMPEFGLLDGIEWSERRDTGARFGASLGYLPEPFANGGNRIDLAVSTWYGWVADDTETTGFKGGYQKTWNDGSQDRDLFVFRAHHLPSEGWTANGTVWLDYYGGDDDDLKNGGFDMTRAHLSTGHRWESGDGLDVFYTSQAFPEIDRVEYTPPTAETIADARDHRLGTSGWWNLDGGMRLQGRAGLWWDQDDEGADISVALEVPEVLFDRSRARLTLFTGDAKFSNHIGTRLGYGQRVGNGRWDVYYELAAIHQRGFNDDADDNVQHRLHGSRTVSDFFGWNVSVYGDLLLEDRDDAYSLGFYLQRSF